MALPGFFKCYNSLPIDLDCMSDGKPFVLKAHTEEIMTTAMAECAIRQSLYKIDANTGEHKYGVIVEGYAPFVPLTKEDIGWDTDDDVMGKSIIDFKNLPGNKWVIKASGPQLQVGHKPLDRMVGVMIGRGE